MAIGEKPHFKLTKKGLRPQLSKLTDEQLLVVARGAVDELTARNVLRCDSALKVFEFLAPENVRIR